MRDEGLFEGEEGLGKRTREREREREREIVWCHISGVSFEGG